MFFFEKPKSNSLAPPTLGGVQLEVTKLANDSNSSDVRACCFFKHYLL